MRILTTEECSNMDLCSRVSVQVICFLWRIATSPKLNIHELPEHMKETEVDCDSRFAAQAQLALVIS